MTEDLFFNKLVTKAMEAVHGDERFFEGYLTVQIKDKQGEITVVDELYKVLPVWMDRGAPISDTHSNRIIGKGINYSKTTYKDKDGEEYPAIKITGKIHKDYELDNEIWKKIKSGEYKGLSFGGATKSDRDPVMMKDGSIAYSLKDLEHYEVAVCADPAVPLALITDYNPVAKSATNAEVREDGKMIIKCDKFGCYVTKANKISGKYFFEGKEIGSVKDVDIGKWFGHVTLNNMPDFAEYGSLDQGASIVTEDGTTHKAPNPEAGSLLGDTQVGAGSKGGRQGGEGAEHDVSEISDKGKSKAGNITKPIPDGKGGKGDFDHCEEKNQDKNDPAAFCGAIQHKLEKAIEAGMLQQIAKNGLEIFLTREELNKVCSACGKTLEEHGVVKYDHSNTMGDQHSMYNQNSGRESWIGQGLPQPTVEGNDDNPAERGLTINGDARQNSGKKKKGRTARNRKRRKQELYDAEIGSLVNQSLESIVSKDSMDGKGSDKPKPEPTQEQKIMDLDISHEGTGYDPERMSYSKRPTDRAWEEWDERQRGMFDQGDYQSFESKNREHWADRGVKSDDIPDYGDWLYEKFPEKEGLKPPRKDALRKSLESIFNKRYDPDPSGKDDKSPKTLFDSQEEDGESGNAIIDEVEAGKKDESKRIPPPRVGESPFGEGGFIPSGLGFELRDNKYITPLTGKPEKNIQLKPTEGGRQQKIRDVEPAAMATESVESAEANKSLESIVSKVTEGQFGAGQRGLGYGNEGYTNVQGSGQSHTITEIPPEMEIIVHDVNEIKESKKEGYTTEAGNNKIGDPSRATDDDDSLLSETYAKKDFVSDLLKPKDPTDEQDDDDYFESISGIRDDDNDTPSKNSIATDFNKPFDSPKNIHQPESPSPHEEYS